VSFVSELKSWVWIPVFWVIIYSVMLVIGITFGNMFDPMYYWWVMLVGVPLTIAPITYKNLVVFLILTMIADSLLWPSLAHSIGWNPITLNVSEMFYQVWLFSGIIGGIGARIIEVRGYTAGSEITIAGFQEPE